MAGLAAQAAALFHVAGALLGRRPAALALMGVTMALAAMLIGAGIGVWHGPPAAYEAGHAALGAPHAWFYLPDHPRRDEAAAAIAAAPGVAAVVLEMPVAILPLQAGGVAGERTVAARIHGIDAAGVDGVPGFALVLGRWPTPGEPEVLIDEGLAKALSLPVGGTAVLLGGRGPVVVRVSGYTVSALHCPYPDCIPAVLLPRDLFTTLAGSPQLLVGVRLVEPEEANDFLYAARQELAKFGVLADGASFLDLRAHQRLSHSLTAGFLFLGGALALLSGMAASGHAVAAAAVAGRRVMGLAWAIGCTPGQIVAALALGCGAVGLLAALAGSPAGWLAARAWLAGASGILVPYSGAGPMAGAGFVVVPILGLAAAASAAGGWTARSVARAGAALSPAAGGVPVRLYVPRQGHRLMVIMRPWRPLLPALAVAVSVATATGAVTLSETMAAFQRDPSQLNVFHDLSVGLAPGQPEATAVEVDALLRADPDIAHFHREAWLRVDVPAARASILLRGLDGDWQALPWRVVTGRFLAGAGEIALGTTAAERLGAAPGDMIEVVFGPRRAVLRVSGIYLELANAGLAGSVTWETFAGLQPGAAPGAWQVRLAQGADPQAVRSRLLAAGGGRFSVAGAGFQPPAPVVAAGRLVSGLAALLGGLAVVAVVHGVAAAVREQRRDIGILKAVGMTPGQLVAAAGTGMAATGAAGAVAGLAAGLLLSWAGFWAASAVGGIGGLVPVFPWGRLLAVAATAPAAAGIAAIVPAAAAAWVPAARVGGEEN